MKRAVFLDRDNTIIDNDTDLGDPQQVRLIQGAASAIASMRGLGYLVVVVSNQGGVARGAFTEQDVQATNQRIAELLRQQANGALIERFYFCPYHPDGIVPGYRREHPWRKPQPGMLLKAAEDLDIDLSQSWMIGDQVRDIQAGAAAGTRTILLAEPDRLQALTAEAPVKPDFVARNLIEAARLIAQHPRNSPANASRDQDQASPATPQRPGKTFPARQNLGTEKHTGSPAPRPARPFKPWEVQPAQPAPTAYTSQPPSPQPATSSAPSPSPDRPDRARNHPTPPVEDSAASRPPAHLSTPAPCPDDSSAEDLPEEETGPTGRTHRLLELILRELKKNRIDYGQWSSYKLLGLGIGQPLVIAAVLAGLLMASDQIGTLNWLVGAAVGQLFVIAMLILHGQR